MGPLLFLIYFKDIQECSEKLQFFSFADDTNILKSLEDIVNLELPKLCDWFTANKLTLNIKKKTISSYFAQLRENSLFNQISIFDNDKNKYVSLGHKEFVKYLGIFIDQNLTWKHHIIYD